MAKALALRFLFTHRKEMLINKTFAEAYVLMKKGIEDVNGCISFSDGSSS